jgi:hypothetical protein
MWAGNRRSRMPCLMQITSSVFRFSNSSRSRRRSNDRDDIGGWTRFADSSRACHPLVGVLLCLFCLPVSPLTRQPSRYASVTRTARLYLALQEAIVDIQCVWGRVNQGRETAADSCSCARTMLVRGTGLPKLELSRSNTSQFRGLRGRW